MSQAEEIGEVRAAHRFDTKALGGYLRNVLENFPSQFRVRQFGHGQSNPTFLLSTRDKDYVLRKKPPGKLLPSAHAVEREYRVLQALYNTQVPVPRVYLLCEDDTVIGTPFYLMEKLEGRVFRDSMASAAADPGERTALFDAMNDVLARLHNVDYEAAGLADFGKTGNYMARQINRWTKQYRASETHTIASMEALVQWLPENIPEDDSTAIVHGDFRLDNLVFHPTEPRVIGVLDWELATLGHPLADLAYNCMGYRLPHLEDRFFGFAGLDLEKTGIPSEPEYVSAYCRRTGRAKIEDWEFFLIFGVFRLAAICQGVYKRGLDGNASSTEALSYKEWTEYLAESGQKILDSLPGGGLRKK